MEGGEGGMIIRKNKRKKERWMDGRRRRSGRDENLMEDRQLSLSSCSSCLPLPPTFPFFLFLLLPLLLLLLPPSSCSSYPSSFSSLSFSSSSLGTGSGSSLPSLFFLSSRSSPSFFLFSSTRVCVFISVFVCMTVRMMEGGEVPHIKRTAARWRR